MADQPTTITIKRRDLLEQRQAIKSLSAAVLSLTATLKANNEVRRKLYLTGLAGAQVAMAELVVKAADDIVEKSVKEHGA